MQINKKLFKNADYGILLSEIAIAIIGIITIQSATGGITRSFKFQIIWLILSLVAGLIVFLVDYNTIGGYHKVLYFLSIGMLILVLLVGSKVHGARSWLGIGSLGIQPSEFAKLTTIITLAKLMEDMEDINTFKNMSKLLFYALLPMLLIHKQPDDGTVLIFAVTILGMLFVGGLNLKVIYGGIITAVLSLTAIWKLDILPYHQRNRIMVFLRPELDRLGEGYNAFIAKVAIGSGNIWGMGINHGNLSSGDFIPESNTDFIFSVFAEEWGFLGSAVLLALYINIVIRSLKIVKTSKDKFGLYSVVGILTMFIFQILQNIGMDIGLMPITGIPLPLMSAGGSSLLTTVCSIAFILNIGARRNKLDFSRR